MLVEDLSNIVSRLKMLTQSVTQMRRKVREMRALETKQELDESKDSAMGNQIITTDAATTARNFFLKSGSDAELYATRKKFFLIPVE